MFSDSAYWYDALYSFKDYSKESIDIISMLKREHPKAESVLNVACGTAEHDQYLSKEYKVDGLDINHSFINVASKKNPQGEYYCSDMSDFSLPHKYDVILCLFSSIGYLKKMESVINALRCFRKHLNQNGIIVIEPWFTPETWNPDGSVHFITGETTEGKICRMNVSDREGSLSILNFNYLVGTKSGVEHFTERHELGLFSVDEMKMAFLNIDLEVYFDEEGLTGRGLYIARKKKRS